MRGERAVWARREARSGRAALPILGILLCTCGASISPARQAACIASPREYKEAWDNFEEGCVSPALLVTVFDGSTLYPEGFWYAWANSSTNLEVYLQLNRRYGNPESPHFDPVRLQNGIKSFLGFPMKVINPDYDPVTRFVVYTLPAGERPLVPSFETWFKLLEDELGLVYPLSAQTELVLAYSTLRPGQDVVDAYTALTRCRQLSPAQMLAQGAFLAPDEAGCTPEYKAAREVAGPGPYDGGESKECFRKFFEGYRGERNAAAIRGVLDLCQDVNAINTGAGLGYNRNENPLVCKRLADQTVAERYTGREFILPNRELSELPDKVVIETKAPDGPYGFLTRGYCGSGDSP